MLKRKDSWKIIYQVLGIQKELRLIKDVFKGESKHCHLGPLYHTDLLNLVLDPNDQLALNSADKIGMAYQLMHAIFHMHSQSITNGDIKPENVFCNFTNRDATGPLLFLSDFRGGIDHSEDFVPLQITTTQNYRFRQDDVASKRAYEEGNRELYKKIEEKADIFAACSLICSIFIHEIPYEDEPGSQNWSTKENLQEELIMAGLSIDTAKLVIQGLEIDYEKRPGVLEILNVIQHDLATLSPDRYQILHHLSLLLQEV